MQGAAHVVSGILRWFGLLHYITTKVFASRPRVNVVDFCATREPFIVDTHSTTRSMVSSLLLSRSTKDVPNSNAVPSRGK